MEELKNNKLLKILFVAFIIISIIHIIYATITMRGMYCDGGFYMLDLLNNFSSEIYKLSFDETHPRFMISFLMQYPAIFAHSILHITNKFVLMGIYSFVQFALPIIFLLWNFSKQLYSVSWKELRSGCP